MDLERKRRALGLIELLVAMAVFSMLSTLVVVLFIQCLGVWRRTSSVDAAHRELRHARSALERDMALTSPTQIGVANVTGHLSGGGKDGPAIWFLSPLDPATGMAVNFQDGRRMWQRNVLYYLVVPAGHSTLYGYDCAGGAAANGYDDRCPHKVLIRKVIDSGTATVATDETTEETLLPSATLYLTQPAGLDISAMKLEPGVSDVRIVAMNLLCCEMNPQPIPLEKLFTLRALSLLDGARSLKIGSDALYDSSFTQREAFSVFLHN